MYLKPLPYYWVAEGHPGKRDKILAKWVHRHEHTIKTYKAWKSADSYYSPKYAGLRCIHSGEGAWNAYNPAGYYGGLQMDASFMLHWGSDMLAKYHGDDARYWSPLDQLRVGYRAVQHIGYSPWPNTRIPCGV